MKNLYYHVIPLRRKFDAMECQIIADQETECIGFVPSGRIDYLKAGARLRMLIAVDPHDASVIGFVRFGIRGPHMTINQIAVRKDTRRKGVATALLDKAIAIGAYTTAVQVSLHCRENIIGGNALWKAYGFHVEDYRDRPNKRRKIVVKWTKAITPALYKSRRSSNDRQGD